MISILDLVEGAFKTAISEAYPMLENPPCMVTPSTKEEFGDYQCNSAMVIVGVLFFFPFNDLYILKWIISSSLSICSSKIWIDR